ncbi:MAG TPA: EcsC family protein [Lentimicrobium sp.]|jgi:uncharacterized protein (DUF697 family)|nr:EcsC family protein [Lentimicrobium sp.]
MQMKITPSTLVRVLDSLYDSAVSGIPGTGSAAEIAASYLKQEGTLRDRSNQLIRWQNTKAASSGFITGIGGFITLPVAIPANLVSVLYIQVRMIAAIAIMGGHNIRDDRVRTLVYACLAGNAAKDILQEAGIKLGSMLTAKLTGMITEKTITAINQKTGILLLSKTGSRSIINLSKAVPLAGGIVGGAFDAAFTNMIGNVARDLFIPKPLAAKRIPETGK